MGSAMNNSALLLAASKQGTGLKKQDLSPMEMSLNSAKYFRTWLA